MSRHDSRVALLTTDLDGTLLRSDSSLSDFSIRTLNAVIRSGIHLVFATGRHYTIIPDHLLSAIRPHYVISSGGAEVYMRGVPHPILRTPIADVGLRAIISALRRIVPAATFDVNGTLHLRDGLHDAQHIDPSLDVLEVTAQVDPAANLRSLAKRLSVVLGTVAEVSYSRTPGILQFTAPGANKGRSLRFIADRLDIGPAQVAVFGDSANDIPMLEWASITFAVADADPVTASVARARCGPSNADGVAHAVARLMGITQMAGTKEKHASRRSRADQECPDCCDHDAS